MKFRMYVDEVGNPDLKSSDNPNHRFLSLTGVIINLRHVSDIVHPELETLKTTFFRSHPDEPVIFHRKEIMNAKLPFEVLRDPRTRELFDNQILIHLAAWDYIVITICIDKKDHRERYERWRYDPYHYCLALLLERYVFFLNRHDVQGDVLAESRGGKEDRRLKASFTKLWEDGTDYVEPRQIQSVLTSKQLKVKTKSNNIAGLQIADLIAHPSRSEILKENGLREEPLPPFAQKIIAILQNKYDQHGGRMFGKKLI